MQTFKELSDREEDRVGIQFKAAMGIIGALAAITLIYGIFNF